MLLVLARVLVAGDMLILSYPMVAGEGCNARSERSVHGRDPLDIPGEEGDVRVVWVTLLG